MKIYNLFYLFTLSGNISYTSVHTHIKLVLGQYIFPYDHWQFGSWLEITLRNVARIQNGRFTHVIHIIDARQYEQTTDNSNELI